MKRGEEFGGKPPPRGPLKPRPRKPVRREGMRPGKTSYEEAPEPRITEPEAVAPPSTEGGVPQTGAGLHEEGSRPLSQSELFKEALNPFSKTLRPWQIVRNYVSMLILVGVVIGVSVFLYGVFSSGTSTPPSGGGGSQLAQEEGGQQGEGGGSKPVTVSNHWVSAVSGKGFRIWDPDTKGYCWWEGDVDLRGGTSGSLTFTYTACNPDLIEVIGSIIGLRITYNIETWKDNGTTIDFTARHEGEAQVLAVQLTRTSGGHLKGSVDAKTTYSRTSENELGMPVEESAGAIEGTLDLVPIR
jgi:hypothetical protein